MEHYPEFGTFRRAPGPGGAVSVGTSSGRRQSALLVPVPAAEPLVGAYRLHHDPVAGAGVPAHVTLVVPWIAPEELAPEHLHQLRDIVENSQPFNFELTRPCWFGERVLWLAPEPAAPFLELTHRLAERFGTPPWEGEFREVVPHLTVGHVGDREGLDEAADAIKAKLPLWCRASEVWVMVGDGVAWRVRNKVMLGRKEPGQP